MEQNKDDLKSAVKADSGPENILLAGIQIVPFLCRGEISNSVRDAPTEN